jgi:26S proteasome regulatory subunit N7
MPEDEVIDSAALDEAVIPLDPLITLLHLRHAFTSQHTSSVEKTAAKERILEIIFAQNMRPYYRMICDTLGWEFDEKRGNEMDAVNLKKLEELDAKIIDATENLGDVQPRVQQEDPRSRSET